MGFANRRGNWSKTGDLRQNLNNTRFEIALKFYIDYNQIR